MIDGARQAVPGRRHYSMDYVAEGRVFSYSHQIDTVLSFRPSQVLEVGTGAGMVCAALGSLGVEITTVDVQAELAPDVVASVLDLPFEDGRFDVAMCCQVLEHLPFEDFVTALRELRRVARYGAVVSLPDVTRSGFLTVKLPKVRQFTINWRLPRFRPIELTPERFAVDGHYWEIGVRAFPLSRIIAAMREAGWTVDADWRVPELQWHHFFRLVPA